MCIRGSDLVDSDDMKDGSVSDIVCYKYAGVISYDRKSMYFQYRSHFHDN
jgi:hypothetical protein